MGRMDVHELDLDDPSQRHDAKLAGLAAASPGTGASTRFSSGSARPCWR